MTCGVITLWSDETYRSSVWTKTRRSRTKRSLAACTGGPGTGQRSLDAAWRVNLMTLSTGTCWENKSIGCANARSSNSTRRAAPRRVWHSPGHHRTKELSSPCGKRKPFFSTRRLSSSRRGKAHSSTEDLVSDLEHSPIASRTTCARPSGHARFSAVLLEVARTSIRRRLDLLRRIAGSSDRMDQHIRMPRLRSRPPQRVPLVKSTRSRCFVACRVQPQLPDAQGGDFH